MRQKTLFRGLKSKKNSGEGAQPPPPVGRGTRPPTPTPLGAFGASILGAYGASILGAFGASILGAYGASPRRPPTGNDVCRKSRIFPIPRVFNAPDEGVPRAILYRRRGLKKLDLWGFQMAEKGIE